MNSNIENNILKKCKCENKKEFEEYLKNSINYLLVNTAINIIDIKRIKYYFTEQNNKIRKIVKLKELKKHKKFFSKQNHISEYIKYKDISLCLEFCYIIKLIIENEKILGLFKDKIPEVEPYLLFENKDYAFVNEVIIILEEYSPSDIDANLIFDAINNSMKGYLYCLNNNYKYEKIFGKSLLTYTEEKGERNNE